MFLLLNLLGCSPTPTCAKGFSAHDDGLCYEDATGDTAAEEEDTAATDSGDSAEAEDTAPATLEDVLADLPACEPTTTDGRLDLSTGCADGVCVGTSADDAIAALGEPDNTTVFRSQYGPYLSAEVDYDWDSGIELTFTDNDEDGLPDAGSGAEYITLSLPWDGGTTDGLGNWASISCFVDALGAPDTVNFENTTNNGYSITSAFWVDQSLSISDYLMNKNGSSGAFDNPDGYVDSITLYGF